jgi:hypothetical protein
MMHMYHNQKLNISKNNIWKSLHKTGLYGSQNRLGTSGTHFDSKAQA